MCRSPPSYAEEPALFALDCEMCATATDDKALLSLCLVDVNGEIVLQVRCLDKASAPRGLLSLRLCSRTCLPPYLVNQNVFACPVNHMLSAAVRSAWCGQQNQ